MYIIQMASISYGYEIFAKMAFLTFDLRSKVMSPNGSPYMVSYMSTTQLESTAFMVTEILWFFEKKY